MSPAARPAAPGLAPKLVSRVREQREAAGLGASELARRVGITRQALHAVESGSYAPNTLIAVVLARELACRVEDLFRLDDLTLPVRLPLGAAGQGRVQLAELGGDLLALPLSGEAALNASADAVLEGEVQGDWGRARLLAPERAALARQTLVVAGCDPSLGLAGDHAGRAGAGRVLWRRLSSLEALRALGRHEAHAAGIHLWDAASGQSNRPFVQRELPGLDAELYTLWNWEQGLMVAPGNPQRLAGVADLGAARLVNRGAGAGSRLLLDHWLDQAGLTRAERRRLPGYGDEVGSHLEAAARVAAGTADAAPGPRSAAQALGLGFVPLQRERFDLVVPLAHRTHPALLALLQAVRSSTFRAELATLGGYDPAHAGDLWTTIPPTETAL